MTKQQQIDRLERLVSDLSRRLYNLERRRQYPYYHEPYYSRTISSTTAAPVFYSSSGSTQTLGNITSQSPSTGSVPKEETLPT